MRGPEGGFYSALDADSEGVEGRCYVWSVTELEQLLGAHAAAAVCWFGVTEAGNFEGGPGVGGLESGLNVLTDRQPRPTRPDLATREWIRARLLAARERRARPDLDDKRLTSWNALMIAALADAGAVLGGASGLQYLDAAERCAEFILRELRDDEGRLLRVFGDGRARIRAYLEDHAFLLEALLVLFEATCAERWLAEARALADELLERFADPERGGFFTTASDHEALLVQRKDLEDTPIPAGSSSAATGLLRLAQLTGEAEYERRALGAIALVAEIAPAHPTAFGHMLQAMHWQLAPARPVACAVPGPAPQAIPKAAG
jgi:uncharacterized protein YyaL (SSP411 family)